MYIGTNVGDYSANSRWDEFKFEAISGKDNCRPSADVIADWSYSTTSEHFEALNDQVLQNHGSLDDDYIVADQWEGDHVDVEEFEMSDNIQFVKSVSSDTPIEIWTYGSYFSYLQPLVSIYWNGEWQDWQTVEFEYYPTWTKNEFAVDGDQIDVYNLKVRYKAQCDGGYNHIDAFYCTIAYEIADTRTTTLIGSENRFFPHEDTAKLGFTVFTMGGFTYQKIMSQESIWVLLKRILIRVT